MIANLGVDEVNAVLTKDELEFLKKGIDSGRGILSNVVGGRIFIPNETMYLPVEVHLSLNNMWVGYVYPNLFSKSNEKDDPQKYVLGFPAEHLNHLIKEGCISAERWFSGKNLYFRKARVFREGYY
ncbi:MAG: hypothetical protein HYS80_01980 [Candidatus Aenigmarchaeota archaeon]|nr:hypothetical protein [Candidatus Aenigmarchaeota archaeon]